MKFSFADLKAALSKITHEQAHQWVLKVNVMQKDDGEWRGTWSDLPGDDCIEMLVSESDISDEISEMPFETIYKRSLISCQVVRGSAEQRIVQRIFDALADYHNAKLPKKEST